MSNITFESFHGKTLTSAEISLLKHIEAEREKIKQAKEAKEKEQRLISQSVYVPNYTGTSRPIASAIPEVKTAPRSTEKVSNDRQIPPKSVNSEIKDVSNTLEYNSQEWANADQSNTETQINLVSSAPIRKRTMVTIEDELQATEQDISKFFSKIGIISSDPWASSNCNENKAFLLPNFSFQGNNTIGIQLSIPSQKQWALNITPENDFFLTDIYLHYNFRYERRKIALSDRQGTWGDVILPFLPQFVQFQTANQQLTLKIVIREEGFFVFSDKLFVSYFKHRRMIPENKNLQLIFNYQDDNGKPMDVIVNRVWWGHQEINHFPPPALRSLEEEAEKVYETVKNPIPPRSIIASGFPNETNLEMLHGMEYYLMDLLEIENFTPEKVSFIPGQGIAFIRMKEADDIPKLISVLPSFSFKPEGDESIGHIVTLKPMA